MRRDLIALAQLSLALDGQDGSFHQDPDLLGVDAGQIHLDDKGILVLANIDGGIPPHRAPGPVNELVEDRMDLMMAETQARTLHDAVAPVDLDSAIAVAGHSHADTLSLGAAHATAQDLALGPLPGRLRRTKGGLNRENPANAGLPSGRDGRTRGAWRPPGRAGEQARP